MPSARPLPDTANEGQTLSFHPEITHVSMLEEHHQECNPPVLPPPLAKVVAASLQTPDTQEKPMSHSPHYSQYLLCHYQPLIAATITFSTSIG